ncbi:MAG: hypothetical protein U1E77_01245 [Inhella sp.]
MHCVIATSGNAPELRAGAELQALLNDWQIAGPDLGGDASSLDTPFEQTLAAAAGLQGAAPLAAWAATPQGLQAPAWAWLSPLHLQLDAQQAIALPPTLLALDEAEGRALFELLAPLFPTTEGWQFECLQPDRWLLGHEQLAGLQLASLNRIAQRSLSPWLPAERWLRRLQNEAQMLLHEHPINQARAARGALIVNSVWMWGAGKGPALPSHLVLEPEPPLDPAEHAEHWARLDGGPIAALRREAAAGRPARLTLAGDVRARSWLPAKPRWRWPWQRRQAPALTELLRELDQ